jgi:hypothetical protein
MWPFFTEGDTKVFNWQLAFSQKRSRFLSPPRRGVSFCKQTIFYLDDKCVKLMIPAVIG